MVLWYAQVHPIRSIRSSQKASLRHDPILTPTIIGASSPEQQRQHCGLVEENLQYLPPRSHRTPLMPPQIIRDAQASTKATSPLWIHLSLPPPALHGRIPGNRWQLCFPPWGPESCIWQRQVRVVISKLNGSNSWPK